MRLALPSSPRARLSPPSRELATADRLVAAVPQVGQLPAFQGNVPLALRTTQRDANITAAGATGWMDSLDSLYAKIADVWMRQLLADFGTDHW